MPAHRIPESRELKKKGTMHVALVALWTLTLVWFNPRLFTLFSEAHSLLGKISLALFIACLDAFWLFGSYYLMLYLFTVLSRRGPAAPRFDSSAQSGVAVLYLTMNDFQREAALSCVNQDYRNFHVFILDDSTREEKRREVDEFHQEFSRCVTVIRRTDRIGFKAGSLNHALTHWVTDHPYFAVIDSDGVLPADFLSRLMPHFSLDERLGFVQGSHRPNPRQKSSFAQDLCLGITPIWTVYFGPRNEYGFVMFLGHGGIIRRDVWEKVGGFPETVAEDLGFSSRIRELGYRGHFVRDVISYEDFPETYPQFRKQQEKYVKGGCQYIASGLPSFLRSRSIPWFEKLDVLISCGSLFLPTLHLVFILTFALVLISALGEAKLLTFSLGGFEISLWNAYALKHSFDVIWTWDFYGITLLNMFAPMLGCAQLAASKPVKLIRLLFLSTVPYLSLMVVCTLGILTYLLTRRAAFLVTGDATDAGWLYGYLPEDQSRFSWADRLNSGHPLTHLIELSTGVILSILCLKTLNLALFGFAISLVLGYFLLKSGWDQPALRSLLFVPFGLIVGSMASLGMNLLGSQGVLLVFFIFHF